MAKTEEKPKRLTLAQKIGIAETRSYNKGFVDGGNAVLRTNKEVSEGVQRDCIKALTELGNANAKISYSIMMTLQGRR